MKGWQLRESHCTESSSSTLTKPFDVTVRLQEHTSSFVKKREGEVKQRLGALCMLLLDSSGKQRDCKCGNFTGGV